MQQERLNKSSSQPESATPTEEATGVKKEGLDEDVDAILGEIDDVLETNAEEFVRSYVQKGGQ